MGLLAGWGGLDEGPAIQPDTVALQRGQSATKANAVADARSFLNAVAPLDTELQYDDAVAKMAAFYEVGTHIVTDSFLNLRIYAGQTCKFVDSVSVGEYCLSVRTYDDDGKQTSSSLLNPFNGTSIAHVT